MKRFKYAQGHGNATKDMDKISLQEKIMGVVVYLSHTLMRALSIKTSPKCKIPQNCKCSKLKFGSERCFWVWHSFASISLLCVLTANVFLRIPFSVIKNCIFGTEICTLSCTSHSLQNPFTLQNLPTGWEAWIQTQMSEACTHKFKKKKPPKNLIKCCSSI